MKKYTDFAIEKSQGFTVRAYMQGVQRLQEKHSFPFPVTRKSHTSKGTTCSMAPNFTYKKQLAWKARTEMHLHI